MTEKQNIYEGEFAVKRDTKNRVNFPIKLRRVFENSANKDDYVSTRKYNPDRIVILPREKLTEVFSAEELRENSPFINEFSLDANGRFLLNPRQVKFLQASQSPKMVVTGNYDYVSIYTEETWDKTCDNN